MILAVSAEAEAKFSIFEPEKARFEKNGVRELFYQKLTVGFLGLTRRHLQSTANQLLPELVSESLLPDEAAALCCLPNSAGSTRK
jgi:hypothetical protein